MWCIPQIDSESVARMADGLNLILMPRPLICSGRACPRQEPDELIREVREPLPVEPGRLPMSPCDIAR
jgi:hypothetical protein